MCGHNYRLRSEEVRTLPPEARQLDRAIPTRRPRPAPAVQPAIEVAPVENVAPAISDLKAKIRSGAGSVLADEARLPTGRAAKQDRMQFRENAVLRYAKGLGVELPNGGKTEFAEAAQIFRTKLMETFDAVEAESLLPKFLRSGSEA